MKKEISKDSHFETLGYESKNPTEPLIMDGIENLDVENPRLRILYVHGFRSSGNSGTSKTLRRLLPDCKVISPDLPVDGEEAVEFLRKIVEEDKIDVVVGTSMGGMLAQKLRGVYKILVNPSFHVSETFRKNMGLVSYFKTRSDWATEFEITPEIVESYVRLENGQFDGITDDEKRITIGVFGRYDDTVNCQNEFTEHYDKVRYFDGGHRLDEDAIRRVIVPVIDYSGCVSFQDCVDLVVKKTLMRIEAEVPETDDFNQVIELFTALNDKGIVGKYGLIVKKMPSDVVGDPTKRFVEAVAYLRDASYKADSIEASGTKQEILDKLREKDFPKNLNYAFGRLLNLLEDI